jgi:N-acyl-D-aspartate/D-glutamate deacylase
VEEAVRKMTSFPAEKLRLRNKGRIVENGDADMTIFNFDTIIDHATYENPKQFSTGIEWVVVNGTVVVDQGRHTGARPGRTMKTR